MKDPSVFLDHILQSIELIEDYTKDITRDEFLKTDFIQDAVIRRIRIIGEASKNLPENFKENHPEIPWQNMESLSDTITEEYFDIDLELIWNFVKTEIPALKKELLKLNEVKITY